MPRIFHPAPIARLVVLMRARERSAHLTVTRVVDKDLPKTLAERHTHEARQTIQDTWCRQKSRAGRISMAGLLEGFGSDAPFMNQNLKQGSVREVIGREIRRIKPDMLIVGTHGRTGIAHALLGSVAGDLLRNPPCDVLAVKAW